MLTFTAEESGRLRAAMVSKNITPSFDELTKAVNRSKVNTLSSVKRENEVIRLISQDESIVIKACSGKVTLARAEEVFSGGIDSDLESWGLDNPSAATSETAVEVYEVIKNATFAEIVKPFETDLGKLCLTQNQIKDFCVENHKWLRADGRDGYATFFLFRKDEKKAAILSNLFVVFVVSDYGGLSVFVSRFVLDSVWYAEPGTRLVFPQLTVSNLI